MQVWDEPRCPRSHQGRWRGVGPKCSVPVLSPFKRWDWKANRSLEYDILVPIELPCTASTQCTSIRRQVFMAGADVASEGLSS